MATTHGSVIGAGSVVLATAHGSVCAAGSVAEATAHGSVTLGRIPYQISGCVAVATADGSVRTNGVVFAATSNGCMWPAGSVQSATTDDSAGSVNGVYIPKHNTASTIIRVPRSDNEVVQSNLGTGIAFVPSHNEIALAGAIVRIC